jgi:hypothetical protein
VKTIAIVVTLVMSTIAVPTVFSPASANRMNGKCCSSSDHGNFARQMRMQNKQAHGVKHTDSK